MKKNHSIYFLSLITGLVLLILSVSSCKKFVDIKLPPNRLYAPLLFESDRALIASLNGVYSAMASSTSDAWIKPSLFADEVASSSDIISSQNTYSSTDPSPYSFFANYYKVIYNANYILEGLANAPAISPDTAKQVRGECLFLRALSHFQLVNYYGTPPLVLVSDFNVAAYVGNTSADSIYASIIADLKAAADLLPDKYPADRRVRANKQTVHALLAKVYLYRKDWPAAIAAASKVIERTELYSINPNVADVFSNTSNETIFQYWNGSGITSVGTTYVPADDTTRAFVHTVRDTLWKSFDAVNDLRYKYWLKQGTKVNLTKVLPFKYRRDVGGQFLIQFRLAELYLIRAEAYAESDKIAEGLEDLEVIRVRANLLDPLTISTKPALLQAVALERQKELMFEAGNRWFDLKRTGNVVTALLPLKPGFESFRALLPYNANANGVIGVNPNIIQNKGY